MPEPRETSTSLLALTIEQQQQPKDIPTITAASAKDKRRKRSSTSSNGTIADTEPTSSRRRCGITKTTATGSDAGSSRTAQRSTTSPKNMSTVNYTKTGRVSKAKKGLKVHECECGRSYTRAEHLRRHQRNHAQEGAMACKYPHCGKTFYRSDLLQRHEDRHNEFGNASRQPSVSSTEHSAHTSPSAALATLPMVPASTIPPTISYPQQQVMSPQQEITPFPRYNPSLFRTPQLPRTPKIAPSNSSNHISHYSPSLKTHTNDSKHQNLAYPARHSISGPVPVDGMAASGAWHDSFVQSPYSCSSGYASPAPGPEFGHIYATPPYGYGVVRTRASSNASFIEQTWTHASQSPTSTISIPYSWSSDEKNIVASSFPYTPVSLPTSSMPMHAGIDAMSHYGQYDPHNVVQMDNEEGAQLFPGEYYGMSQIVRAYPFEQWLNNYWRLFHPTFPVVHRFTFARLELSPMLYAAMIAIDLQYSNDASQKRKARELHKLCVGLLSQREQMNRTGCDRLCDSQAIFLVEVFSQYCAQRCSKALSPRFELMYQKLAGIRTLHPSAILDLHLLFPTSEDNIDDRWIQWAKLSARQHLLLSCYVLEFQQATLLARDRERSLQIMSDDLAFPVHESLWDATTASEWVVVAREQSEMPTTVREALQTQFNGRYNHFQSAVLVAAHYDHINGPEFGMGATLEHLLSNSSETQLQLLTAKLAQLLPMRALLSVAGETWVFGTKLTSQEECSALSSTLQEWISQLWLCPVDDAPQPTTEALHISVAILKLSLETSMPLTFGLGNELGIFLAALVLWAATAAASSRLLVSGFSPQRSLPHSSMTMTSQSGIQFHGAPQSMYLEPIPRLAGFQQSSPYTSSDRRPSLSYYEILSNTSRFLSSTIEDITSFNVEACHTGCKSLLLWVKMHLRGAFRNEQYATDVSVGSPRPDCGEIINEAIVQIERMLDHGWDDWGI